VPVSRLSPASAGPLPGQEDYPKADTVHRESGVILAVNRAACSRTVVAPTSAGRCGYWQRAQRWATFCLTRRSESTRLGESDSRKRGPLSQFLHQEPEKAEGQATFEIANLRRERTNLPFVVWVSQKDGARHDVRVKVGYNPKAFPAQMGVYAVRPFGFVAGQQLLTADEHLLEAWISKNIDIIIAYWDADIEYTEDFLDKVQPI
jgi:hypothetical protein